MLTTLKKIYFSFSRSERLGFFVSVLLAIASIAALAAAFFADHTALVPASGGTYTEGIVGQPGHPNPVLASADADKSLVRLLFANLAELSDSVSASKDGKIWSIRLKENARWSDGEKLTSDDVIFTIQKIQDPDTGSPLAPSWQGIAPQRVSELELTLTLGNPYAFFEDNLKNLYILPKHLFAETPAANWRLSRYNLEPVGSGPYAFASYDSRPDGFITAYRLKKNPRYGGNPPLIEDFRIAFFPNIPQLLAAFNAGQIDGFGGLEPHDAVSIQRSYDTYEFPMPSYYAVFFNQNQNLALQEQNVREALDMAIDRNLLIGNVLNGKGEARTGPVPPPLIPDAEISAAFSADEASALLEKSGWHAQDGVRQKKIKGTIVPLEFELTVPNIPFLTETANELKTQWQSIGANVTLTIRPIADVASDAIKNRNYQAILFGNVLNPSGDLFPFWHSSERFYPGLNLSLYNRKSADQLIESIRRTLDPDARAQKLSGLETAITNDTPAVFLYSPYYLYFTRKDLQGVNPVLIEESSERFVNTKEWYLKTTRVLK